MTETVGVRPTARLADRPEFVVPRSRSRTPDKAVRSPRLRRPLDIAIPGSSGHTSHAQSPPPAQPPSPMPAMSQYLGSDDESSSTLLHHPHNASRHRSMYRVVHRLFPCTALGRPSTAELNADAMGLACQLADSLHEQLQQATNREVRQADEARKFLEATARKLRLQQEALERERRQSAEARQLQEEVRKAQEEARKIHEVAYNMEMERARHADRREDRLFDQFRDCMEKTRSDLNEAALLRERAARLELQLMHAQEAATAAAAAAERTQPTEVAPPTVCKYFASGSEVATGTQPLPSRKLAKKMRQFFASAIPESEVEQDSTATAAGTTSDTAAGIASAQTVQPPLMELEPTASVAPPTSTHAHVFEPGDVIDVDEPVWILRTTEPTATTSTHSTSYIAHSSVLPRTALSASQSKGTAPAAHTL